MRAEGGGRPCVGWEGCGEVGSGLRSGLGGRALMGEWEGEGGVQDVHATTRCD